VDLDVTSLGSGPPLVFLHGEDGLLFNRPLLDRLAEHFTVLAPFHPGWGGSIRPAAVTTIDDIAYLYLDFLAAQPAPVTVLGVSVGAWIAAEVATKNTAGIAGLVLAAPVGIKLGGREDRAFVDLYAVSQAEVTDALYGDATRAKDLQHLDDDGFLELAKAEEAVARYVWQPYMHNPKLPDRLHRIDVPALVVGGDADRFVLEDGYVDAWAELIGVNASAVTIAGAGHRLDEEAPDQLARLVHEFAQTPLTSSMREGA
jgi:pimeloyl-ACP methyl ester carboxylesterase